MIAPLPSASMDTEFVPVTFAFTATKPLLFVSISTVVAVRAPLMVKLLSATTWKRLPDDICRALAFVVFKKTLPDVLADTLVTFVVMLSVDVPILPVAEISESAPPEISVPSAWVMPPLPPAEIVALTVPVTLPLILIVPLDAVVV